MARELHDVIGHTVNVLVVQAGAARLTLDTDPGTTRAMLLGMEALGRDALADLDSVLGRLTEAVEPPEETGKVEDDFNECSRVVLPADPPPGLGLAALGALVSRFDDTDVKVALSVEQDLRLPRHLDLAAYRIVQEALTNVLKHAGPCSAQVSLDRDGGSLVIEISDNGHVIPGANSSGRGLIGIAERISSCDGFVSYGPVRSGGWTVRASLPLP